MHRYIFDRAAETAEGFASLDALCNFRSFRFLETTASALACVPIAANEDFQHATVSSPVVRSARAELDKAYALLADRFPEETLSRGVITRTSFGGPLQIGLLITLVALLIVIAVNFSLPCRTG